MTRQCFLKCFLGLHSPISLPHNTEILVGRSKITQIKDQSCSRLQISLKADCENCTVEVKQLGVNPSGIDGLANTKNAVYNVAHGTRVELLISKYTHIIEFEPPPEGCEKIKLGNKRKLGDDEEFKESKILKMDSDTTQTVTENDVWEDIDKGELYIYTSQGVKSSSKIAAFDMDGTLIKTKSGKVHPVDTSDWLIGSSQVSPKLKDLHAKGFKIIILTNQAPIGKGRVKISDFKKKMEGIVQKLSVPIQAFIATGKGLYRKPTTGMWKILTEQKNDGIQVDMSESFYVGDAAGRVANWAPGKKKDHSMADRLMAENLNLRFMTPEQFFLDHSVTNVQIGKPEFCPKELQSEPFMENLLSDSKEILVLVGYPGSGKSFLAKQIEKKSNNKYATVCRDLLGSWQKCASEASRLIQQGKSVIVDSTNPDEESRKRWTSLAREQGVQCRCANMTTTFAHALHNNKFRELTKANHVPVADMIFYSFKKKYKKPTKQEGFEEVLDVQFCPSFEDKELEKLYMMHLLEK